MYTFRVRYPGPLRVAGGPLKGAERFATFSMDTLESACLSDCVVLLNRSLNRLALLWPHINRKRNYV